MCRQADAKYLKTTQICLFDQKLKKQPAVILQLIAAALKSTVYDCAENITLGMF